LGANVKNAYFIKVMSAATGGVVTNFSPRFSLTGMTGVFPPAVTAGLKTVSGTDGPDTINQVTSPQVGANPAAPAGAAEFDVPYTMQTGQVKYAPMPMIPGTKITAKNRSPQHPTSAYTVYRTGQGPPNAITTMTDIQTFVVSSREATVCRPTLHFLIDTDRLQMTAQSQPAMEKFLNRWKD
jgi:Yeast cell wall synthesis protein KRE9/KNH1